MLIEKVIILVKYSEFAEVFSKKSVAKLFKYYDLNKYLINPKPGDQPLYGPIYNLKLIELKILKTYIKTNLANGFIRFLESPTGALISFV